MADDNVIDYSTKEGRKIYEVATAALPVKFDLQTKNLLLFLKMLGSRAKRSNWADVLSIPDAQAKKHDLIKDYGQVSMSEVRSHAATYMEAEDRKAQNSAQIVACLELSLSKEALKQVYSRYREYKFNGQENRPMMLKVIISLAHIDTKATVSFIRTNLSSLDSYMEKIGSNIETFNEYVRSQHDALEARGEQTQDLLVNLFKGYMAVKDKAFRDYMAKKKDEYEEGANINEDSLMEFARNKYRVLVQEERWNSKSPEEQQIVALTAQVSRMQSYKPKVPTPGKPTSTNPGRGKGGYRSGKQGEKNKRPDWVKQKPRAGQDKRTVDGKEYFWCQPLQIWARHKPEDCRASGGTPNAGSSEQQERPTYQQVLASVAEAEENQA